MSFAIDGAKIQHWGAGLCVCSPMVGTCWQWLALNVNNVLFAEIAHGMRVDDWRRKQRKVLPLRVVKYAPEFLSREPLIACIGPESFTCMIKCF